MKTVCRTFLSGIQNKGYYKFVSALVLFISLSVLFAFNQVITADAYIGSKNKTFTIGVQKNLSKTYTITGRVTQTFSYCGGAAPPKQLLDQLATPVAYPGKKFYIRVGKINSTKSGTLKSFTTGEDGEFSIRLAPGTYSIILEEQLHKIKSADITSQTQRVDEKCLAKWWAKPYYLLKITDKNIGGLNFNFHHHCFISPDIPCIEYTGQPLP